MVMVSKVTSMKVITAAIAKAEGAVVNVSAVCRDNGVSRQHFYDLHDRYVAGGLEALEPRSRRPHRSPNQTSVEVEERIVRLRKDLAETGLDHGATTIQWHLGRQNELDVVPSVATVHRILDRRGLVTAQPHKRPKSSWKRFEAPAPNECWQIDATDWVIATGLVKIFNIIDDYSRVAVRSRAVSEASSSEAWTTFCQAGTRFGLPAGVLSDNGLCFSGKLRGFEVVFEANLRDAGINPFCGRPYHPQTTGKIERFQQTLKKWLRRRRLAADLIELQAQLDEFCHIYNHERPHQGISGQIPIERFESTSPSQPAPGPLEHPTQTRNLCRKTIVTQAGSARIDRYIIHLGIEYARHTATIVTDNVTATVFINNALVRHLVIDHTRSYEPSGKPRGRRPRLAS